MWFIVLNLFLLSHVGISKLIIKPITIPVEHSECPSWDPRTNILYYVNIFKGQIFRYNYLTKITHNITLAGTVAPVVQSKDNPHLLIAGVNTSVVAVHWDDHLSPIQTRVLANIAPQFPKSRTNDGKADKRGRFWVGTTGPENPIAVLETPNEGLLSVVTCSDLADPVVKIAPVNVSNGLAWNSANDKFFYIDTPTNHIVSYDFDEASGDISNQAVVFDLVQYNSQNAGTPLTGRLDGMTIDADDNLWVALHGGHGVIQVCSRTGVLLDYIKLPVKEVTSVMFGNPDLTSLFVTTSRLNMTAGELEAQPDSGAVFEVQGLNATGVPVFPVDLLASLHDTTCGGTRHTYHKRH